MSVNFATRVSTVRSIGAAEVKATRVAAEIIESVPATFDWSARGAMAAQVHQWATGTDVKAEWPAQRAKKIVDGEEVNEVTNYGRGVNTIVAAIRRALKSDDDAPKPYRVAVTGSGDGGPTGTLVIAADDPLYAALVERLGAPSGE